MLRVAAGYSQLPAAKALLIARAAVNQVTSHHSGLANPLHAAALWGANLDILRLLLQARADANITTEHDGQRRTAMQIAEAQGQSEQVQCFKDFQEASASGSPSGSLSVVDLEHAPPLLPEAVTFGFGQTRDFNESLNEDHEAVLAALDGTEKAWMLRVAARYDQVAAAKTLLGARASVDHATFHRSGGAQTALHSACVWNASPQMIRLLLESAADPNVQTECEGQLRTALQVAEARGHLDQVQCFQEVLGTLSNSSPTWAAAQPRSPSSWSATQSWGPGAGAWGVFERVFESSSVFISSD